MPETVYVTAGSSPYHLNNACQALDTARLNSRGTILVATAHDRPACLVCATPPRNEWVLTPENLGGLLELIEPSKPHYAWNETEERTVVDGLTIWPHNTRIWVRFGDTITRDLRGRYAVTSPEGAAR